MLHTLKGIVFHAVKYSETSVIVKIYTDLFGLQSYLVKGIRSPKSRIRPGLFQPLTLLELVAQHKERHGLQSIREIRFAHPYQELQTDIRKSSVALFLNELVYKSVREEEANPELFDFLWDSFLLLDQTTDNVSHFHLVFALQLTGFLGIVPQHNHSATESIFNLREGYFQPSVPDHPHYLDQADSKTFFTFLQTPLAMQSSLQFSPAARGRLLETVLLYYRLHLPGLTPLQSHHILHTVLS
jgi:DNA repair protein RecO (recombination protein O)